VRPFLCDAIDHLRRGLVSVLLRIIDTYRDPEPCSCNWRSAVRSLEPMFCICEHWFPDCADHCDREGVQRGALGYSLGRTDGAQADERDAVDASLWGARGTARLTSRGDFAAKLRALLESPVVASHPLWHQQDVYRSS